MRFLPVEAVVRRVDVQHIVDRIDMNELLERVDLDQLLDRIDIDKLMSRIDLDTLVGRVDVDKIVDRVDVAKIVDRVDFEEILDRIDMNELLDRIDIEQLISRTELGGILMRSTTGIAERGLDFVRAQGVGLDQMLNRWVNRVLRRDASEAPSGPALLVDAVGNYAGPVTRVTAFALDSAVSGIALAVIVAAASAVIELVARRTIDPADAPPAVGSILVLLWLFLYYYVSWSAAGKTVGMAMLGLRVVRRDGSALDHRHAFLRVLAFPFSFLIFGLGFAGIVVGREHRALHDVVGDTTVVYDWDARAAKLRILAADGTQLAPSPRTGDT